MFYKIAISLLAGIIVGILLTELLSNIIFFSLFIGIPIGFFTAIIVYVALKRENEKIKK